MSGREWIVEAYGCHPSRLADLKLVENLIADVVRGMDLRPVAETQWHQFPGTGGITGLTLLAESHIACHTFPEYRSLCLNVFCCAPREEWEFSDYLTRRFGATTVQIRRIERPYATDDDIQ